ncbi:MAG: signal peptidase I [Oscillospiraceae bacterium]
MTEKKTKHFWKENWSTVAMAVFVALFAATLLLGLWKPVVVHQTSMYPTLRDGDYIFIVKTGSYERGDIVVFSSEELGQENLVKRVIGLPGEHVQIFGGSVYIDGELLQEPYLEAGLATEGDVDLTVSEGCVFLLGDNRSVSIDSRVFGEVRLSDILGEVKLRVFHKPSLF